MLYVDFLLWRCWDLNPGLERATYTLYIHSRFVVSYCDKKAAKSRSTSLGEFQIYHADTLYTLHSMF
jgi:hypothetical protein